MTFEHSTKRVEGADGAVGAHAWPIARQSKRHVVDLIAEIESDEDRARGLTLLFFGSGDAGDAQSIVRPEQLSAAAREGKPGPNQIPADLTRVVERPHGLRLEFTSPALSGGVRVNLSRSDYERLKETRAWVVEFPAEALRVV